jgi:hypothetical protein
MVEQMKTKDDVLRSKVLIEINEDFHQADKLNEALDTGIVMQLVYSCRHQDDSIRELASRAILKIANTEKGRVTLVVGKILAIVAGLFDDKVTKIRHNAYTCLINLAQFTYGIQNIIDSDILRILVDKLIKEKEYSILVLILKLINILLEGAIATDLILQCPALSRLNGHLKSKNWEIRKLAAENLGSISYNQHGKEQTISAESIPPLCEMLSDEIFEVRASAVRALASLAQLKEGKIQIYDLDMLNKIIELLYDMDEQIRLNTVQLVAAVAEYPPARSKFKQCLDKLNDMATRLQLTAPLVAEHA